MCRACDTGTPCDCDTDTCNCMNGGYCQKCGHYSTGGASVTALSHDARELVEAGDGDR
jgi:hypothetical protein